MVGEIHDRKSRDAVASNQLVRAGSLAGDRVVKPSLFEPDVLVTRTIDPVLGSIGRVKTR